MDLTLPLMSDNISREDVDCLIEFLKQDPVPRLTNGDKVKEFENKWSEWLGVKHSVFVNSGTAANELTMLSLKHLYPEGGEVIIPPLTWVSDVNSVLFSGFNPVFSTTESFLKADRLIFLPFIYLLFALAIF